MTPIDILERHRDEIDRLCERFKVSRLRLFGSALTEAWNESTSDLDFLVEYSHEAESLPPLERLVGLQLALEDLLGRPVDIVNWQIARNPYFRQNAERNTREIYAA